MPSLRNAGACSMIAEMSQWKLTQIKSTGASEPTLGEATLPLPSRKIAPSRRGAWAGRLTLVPDLQEIAPSRRGAWQLMGARSCATDQRPFSCHRRKKDHGPPGSLRGAFFDFLFLDFLQRDRPSANAPQELEAEQKVLSGGAGPDSKLQPTDRGQPRRAGGAVSRFVLVAQPDLKSHTSKPARSRAFGTLGLHGHCCCCRV